MNKIHLKPKSRKEIADDLGISYSTFWRLIKKLEIDLPSGLVYSNKQKEIFQALDGGNIKDIETN